MEGESIHPTVHPQIVITAAPQPDPLRVAHWLARATAAALDENDTTRRLLSELVTEYTVVGGEPALPAAVLQSTPVLT